MSKSQHCPVGEFTPQHCTCTITSTTDRLDEPPNATRIDRLTTQIDSSRGNNLGRNNEPTNSSRNRDQTRLLLEDTRATALQYKYGLTSHAIYNLFATNHNSSERRFMQLTQPLYHANYSLFPSQDCYRPCSAAIRYRCPGSVRGWPLSASTLILFFANVSAQQRRAIFFTMARIHVEDGDTFQAHFIVTLSVGQWRNRPSTEQKLFNLTAPMSENLRRDTSYPARRTKCSRVTRTIFGHLRNSQILQNSRRT